ncbi:MAG: chemotaxis protein CheW [Planctomycetota bacterium]
MNKYKNFLFTTFLLEEKHNELNIRCLGCREIMTLKHKTPSQIRGLIEYNSIYAPVIDLNLQFYSESTLLGNSSCILIVKHRYNDENLYSGILIDDVKQIYDLPLEISRMKSLQSDLHKITKLVTQIDTPKNIVSILNENHLALDKYESLYKKNQDYLHFKKLQSQDYIKN